MASRRATTAPRRSALLGRVLDAAEVSRALVIEAPAATPNGDAPPGSATPALADLPSELERDLRRLLAEALVRDYLADQQRLKADDGDGRLGNAIALPRAGKRQRERGEEGA